VYVSAAVYCSSSSSESSPATCREKKRGERGTRYGKGVKERKRKGRRKEVEEEGEERVGVKNLVEEVMYNDNYLLQSLTIKPH